MSAMDWDKLKVFHAAAEAGSFTHAGEQLGLSQSAVSRQVVRGRRHAVGRTILLDDRRATRVVVLRNALLRHVDDVDRWRGSGARAAERERHRDEPA